MTIEAVPLKTVFGSILARIGWKRAIGWHRPESGTHYWRKHDIYSNLARKTDRNTGIKKNIQLMLGLSRLKRLVSSFTGCLFVMLRKIFLGLSLSLSMLGVSAAVSSKPASAAYPGQAWCDKVEVSSNQDRNFYRGQLVNFACNDKAVVFQTDGNLVVYRYNWGASKWEPKWATGTWDGESPDMRAARFSIQADGNMVLYNYQNKAIWATMTNGNRGAQLAMQNDGNLVVYTSDGRPIWATMTNGGTQRTFTEARDKQRGSTSTSKADRANQFFNWANGKWAIQRLDREEARRRTGYYLDGECATLVLRYFQDVF